VSARRRADGSHRVVVTGMGAIHGFGHGVAALWQAVAAADCAIVPTTLSRGDQQITVPAARIPGYRERDYFSALQVALLDPFAQYALLAGREAVADAGLAGDTAGWRDAAVIIGNGGGGELAREEAGAYLFTRGSTRVHPLTVPRTNHQAVVSHLAADTQAFGPAYVISTGCASGTHALAQATWMIRHGLVNRALSGGCEANAIFSVACAFTAVRTVARDTSRPFSHGRTGFSFGEGAGILVLESLEAAHARGARIHGEILGVGMSIDPADQVHPSHLGPTLCLTRTLKDAGREPGDIAYINGHGTGTILNDSVESAAVRDFFGPHADRLALSSSKSQLGHSFGASGALEAIICLKALRHQMLPPTVNWLGPDPDCPLDPVANEARSAKLETVLTQSFGFGGVNAALALGLGG
jgi:nodulation protein E